MVALLNDKVEADVCQDMLEHAQARLTNLQAALTTSVLDRETYLQKIGAAKELEQLVSDLTSVFDRNFNV